MKRIFSILLIILTCSSTNNFAQVANCNNTRPNMTSPTVWCGYVLGDLNDGNGGCLCDQQYDDLQCARLYARGVYNYLQYQSCLDQSEAQEDYCEGKQIPLFQTFYGCSQGLTGVIYYPITNPWTPEPEKITYFRQVNGVWVMKTCAANQICD